MSDLRVMTPYFEVRFRSINSVKQSQYICQVDITSIDRLIDDLLKRPFFYEWTDPQSGEDHFETIVHIEPHFELDPSGFRVELIGYDYKPGEMPETPS